MQDDHYSKQHCNRLWLWTAKSECKQPRHWTCTHDWMHKTPYTAHVQLRLQLLHKHVLTTCHAPQWSNISVSNLLLQSTDVSQSTSRVTFQTMKTARPGTLDHGEVHQSPPDRPGGAPTSVNGLTDSTDLTVLTCRWTGLTGVPSGSC